MADTLQPAPEASRAGLASGRGMDGNVETIVRGATALIFDCDGTLLKTPDLYAAAWQSAFAKAGHEMDPDWYHQRAGMSEHVLLDAFEAEKGITLDRFRAVRDLRHFILAHVGSVEKIPAIAAIACASHGHKPMAVASGGSHEIVHATLQASGLLPLFETVVTIDDVGKAKPAPDLFLEAANRLKAAPSSCLVFEDSPQGIEAAEAAGMRCVDVNPLL